MPADYIHRFRVASDNEDSLWFCGTYPPFIFGKPSTTIQNMKQEIKDFSPGKWEDEEDCDLPPLSFGQRAVAYAGIPDNADTDAYRIKSSIAELIDIVDLRVPIARAATEDGFLQRMTKDDATKKLIDACEAAVKYITMSR